MPRNECHCLGMTFNQWLGELEHTPHSFSVNVEMRVYSGVRRDESPHSAITFPLLVSFLLLFYFLTCLTVFPGMAQIHSLH